MAEKGTWHLDGQAKRDSVGIALEASCSGDARALVNEALSSFRNNILAPFVNSAVIEPYDMVAHNINAVTGHAGLGKILLETKGLAVKAAGTYSAGWFAQTISGGLGALVPYTIAGKAMGSVFRCAGASAGSKGLVAAALKSEQAAYVAGAFIYDGLRPTEAGESHLANALGGAAGFTVFGIGNKSAAAKSIPARLLSRTAIGFMGADLQMSVSTLVARQHLPTFDDLMQAGVSGAAMNYALPAVQNSVNKRMVDWQVNTRFGSPADLYLRAYHADSLRRSPELQGLLYREPWARVCTGGRHPAYEVATQTVNLPRGKQTPCLLARELAHLGQVQARGCEPGFQLSYNLLASGKIADAWNVFHSIRAGQETKAYHCENVVDHQLNGRQMLNPDHLALEIGAWPAPGGTSQEARWRQEFAQFLESGGKWRPGDKLTVKRMFDPNAEKASSKQGTDLTESERQLEHHERLASGLIDDLQKQGFIAVLAGGAVRDAEMGGKPKDFDIASSATPDEVEQLFASKGYRVLAKGKQFGVMSVVRDGMEFEIATLRNDGQYSDGRRPDQVRYVGSLYEDAARRDLRINAMFHDPLTGTTYDLHGGCDDIRNKVIRTVGDPNCRFAEDQLRMLRVARFASRFGFAVAPETLSAIQANAKNITNVSPERIGQELRGILKGADPLAGLNIMMASGLMREVLPELADLTGAKAMQDPVWHPEGLTWTHTRMVLDKALHMTPLNYPYRFERLLGIVLHDIGKPATQKIDHATGRITNVDHAEVGAQMADCIARRLKLSNPEKDRVVSIVREHMKMHTLPELRRSKLMDMLSHPYIEDLKVMQHSDVLGTGRADAQSHSLLDWIEQKQHELAHAQNEAQRLGAGPIVDGQLLISMGLKPGPRLGEIKAQALAAQQEGTFSTQEEARKWLKGKFPEFAGALLWP